MVVDLRTAEGQDELRGLAAEADVVIEAFAPGVADGWGIGYERLRAANPRSRVLLDHGFGSTGPYARPPGLRGHGARPRSGHCTSARVRVPAGPDLHRRPDGEHRGRAPWRSPGSLAALTAREQTGRGQQVEASLVQGLVPCDYFGAMMWQDGATADGRRRTRALTDRGDGGRRQPHQLLRADCRRPVGATSPTCCPTRPRRSAERSGSAHTIDDPGSPTSRSSPAPEDAQEWEDLVWEALRTKTVRRVGADPARRRRHRLRAGPRAARRASTTRRSSHNGDVVTVEDPEVGPVRAGRPGGRTSADARRRSPARHPALGEHGGDLTPHVGAAPRRRRRAARRTPWPGSRSWSSATSTPCPTASTMAAALGARVIKLEDLRGRPDAAGFGSPRSPR